MEKCVNVLQKRAEELEKNNKELEKSKKILELQLKANENVMKLMKKQMEDKAAFYNNALQAFMTKDADESNLLLKNNEKIVAGIGSKRSRNSLAAV